MNTVDLFTGIGGFHRALAPIARPMLYCDIDNRAQNAIETHMQRGIMPRAPIIDDVRDIAALKRVVGRTRVDMIVSSSPCTGFSSYGKHEGLDNAASGLFRATIDVIARFRPALVFFENVAPILNTNNGDDLTEISRAMRGLNYSMRWTVVSGVDVGAPQVRRRWFCLCVRQRTPASRLPDLPREMVEAPEEHWRTAPPLLGPADVGEANAEMFMLGNSIVPQAARHAFVRLYTGFRGGVSFSRTCLPLAKGRRRDMRGMGYPSHACLDVAGNLTLCDAPKFRLPDERIVLDPSHFPFESLREYKGKHDRAQPIRSPVVIRAWPTPRSSGVHHSYTLSARTMRDLPTCAVFCSEWRGRAMPRATSRGERVGLHFVCWLMGYPATYLDASRAARRKATT